MPTRREMQERRLQLRETLLEACRSGKLVPDQALPPMRELARQHGISAALACQVIQGLVDEGVLYARQGAGTFVGRPLKETVEPYLMLWPSNDSSPENFWTQVQAGFEDRIAQLGGHSIVLRPFEAQSRMQLRQLPPLSGIFGRRQEDGFELFKDADVPLVHFGALDEGRTDVDHVGFDDIGGGVQSTLHLWKNGHRNIGFLGLHSRGDAELFPWSVRRELGWRKALEQVGVETENLAFHPRSVSGSSYDEQLQVGREIAEQLMGRPDITAVVAANIIVSEGVFAALQEANLPAERWPAVVCFDAAPNAASSVVSYLRLPWEEIGREAAQILWERRSGRLSGGAIERLVPLRLVPRLSCRPDWALSSGLIENSLWSQAHESVVYP